jgi:2-aminoadipate transaminase
MTTVNFLRGVPADVALVPVAEAFSAAYSTLLEKHGPRLVQYQTPGLSDFNGFIPLKQILAERLGVQGDPAKRMICSNGGMETFSLLLKSYPRGSVIATEALTYDRVLSDIRRLEHQTVGVPLVDDGVDLDALEQTLKANGASVFYQIGYHHNPVGLTTSLDNLETASRICAEHDVLHVIDIAYYELRFDGAENQLVDLEKYPETTALVGSFTKTLSPGAKCGFGVFPGEVLERLTPVVANTRLNPNYPTQAAIHHLIDSGFYDEHLAYLVNLYRPRMEAVNECLQNRFAELGAPVLTGGFFVGISLPGISDEQRFVEELKKRDVVLAPPQVYAPGYKEQYVRENNAAFFRLTFPFFTAEENTRGVEAIAETYHELA